VLLVACMLVGGLLGDTYGRRRVLVGVLLSTIVLLAGQADLIQRLSAQQLSPAQAAAAVVALNTACRRMQL
jgi:MFS family permease